MSLGTILLIIVILALVGVFPAWPHAIRGATIRPVDSVSSC